MPTNTIINFVPQQEIWIVERFGKFHKKLEPGLNVCAPVIDRIRYRQSLKETAYNVPHQTAITADNVSIDLDGVLFTRVIDPYKASYNISEVGRAVEQLAQTAMRSEIGFLTLDNVLRERQALNQHITQSINEAALDWGITCFRYEIKDIRPPKNVLLAMEKQLNAERTKRAEILDSEGRRESAVNKAQGEKQSSVLKAEAQATNLRMVAQGNKDSMQLDTEARQRQIIMLAEGQAQQTRLEAEAKRDQIVALAEASKAQIILNAQAEASRIQELSSAIAASPAGRDAVNLMVADKYIEAFKEMGRSSNTMVVPGDMSNMSGLVASGLGMFSALSDGTKAQATKAQATKAQINGH